MADDFTVRMEEEEDQNNPAGVPECLVDSERRMHPVGLGQADSDDISTGLVRQVLQKVVPLELSFARPGINFEIPGYAQGGFIRVEETQRQSPTGEDTYSNVPRYSVLPITAKHNLRKVTMRGHLFSPVAAKLNVPSVGRATIHDSSDFGWLPAANDGMGIRPADGSHRPAVAPWGFDVSVGGLINSLDVPFTLPFCSFSLVRDTFVPEVGQKVGLAVLFNDQTKPTKTTIAGSGERQVPITEETIRLIYGEPDKVNIYTGAITYVGPNHIEYSLNSFTGCSGAVVFLLDKNQPACVQPCDTGRALAIHSGSHPFLQDRNYGFIIRRHPAFRSVLSNRNE